MKSLSYSTETLESVRALYDYFSSDEASLSFKKGEIIKVLTELESGWCQGEKNGEKGWFPKNFVERIDIDDNQRASFMQKLNGQNSKQSLNSMDNGQFDRTKNWIAQTIKSETNNGYEKSIDSIETSSLEISNKPQQPPIANIEDWQPTSPFQKPLENLDINNTNNNNSIIIDKILPRFCPPGNTLSEINSLPLNWCKKMTANNKIYYFNMLTDESTWKLPNINSEKKKFEKRYSMMSEHSIISTLSDITWIKLIPAKAHQTLLYSSDLNNDNLNWDGIISNIVCNVHKLIYTIKMHSKTKYLKNASLIVESIRIMLLTSGTAESDSPIFKSHQLLKGYHRLILLSLCDLVLMAKVASGIWPPPDMQKRLENEAINILMLSRLFVQVAQQVSISSKMKIVIPPADQTYLRQQTRSASQNINYQIHKVKHSNSSYTKDRRNPINNYSYNYNESRRSSHQDIESEIGGDQSQQSNTEILKKFNSAAQTTFNAIEVLSECLEKNNDISQQLINLIRRVVEEVGHFVKLLDQFSLDNVSSEHVAMFNAYRQTLFDNINLLVLVTKTITENYSKNGTGSTDQILNNTTRIEKSINHLLIAIKFVLEEKDLKEYNELRRKLNIFSTILNKSIEKQTLIELSPPIRRCFSHSSLTSSINSNSFNSQTQKYPMYSNVNLKYSENGFVSGSDDETNDSIINGSNNKGGDNMSRINTRPSDKLKKLLGKEVPLMNKGHGPKDSLNNKSMEEKPWFLGHDYTPDMLVFEKSKVRGGTAEGLVECLTFHDNFDPNFMATFMLTYRSFVSTSELFRLIFKRFNLPPPHNLSQPEYEIWFEKKLKVIRVRIFNILKTWVENYFQESEDMEALEELKQYVSTIMKDILPQQAIQLLKHIEKRLDPKTAEFKKMVKKSLEEPIPILPKNYDSFLDMEPLEIARQLTLIDSQLFNLIKPNECLNKAWSRNDGTAPNVKKMIKMSTQISNWVALTILFEDSIRTRGLYIKHFIAIAVQCMMLHNFNTLMSLIAGLNSSPIHRLKRTWENVSLRAKTDLDEIKRIMNTERNFAVYREQLHSINPPCVPFLGVYLTDLTFIADGNPDYIADTKLFNFFKQSKSADLIREIQQYQNSTYYLKSVPKLQEYLLSKMDYVVTEAQLYDRSVILEPKEREEEKIARLLHESGFL
ncbi:ras GEF [Neoconidiobolus thromboides FSU 785]|nr:ras GEF [Neoconidiobolus thromboides FSU 785]